MRSCILFKNLKAEMAREDISIQDIADTLKLNRDTVARKLSMKSSLNLDEAFKIQKQFFPEKNIFYLFKELDNSKTNKAS